MHDADFELNDVYCQAQDILLNPDWYGKFYEEAVNLLSAEASRCHAEIQL